MFSFSVLFRHPSGGNPKTENGGHGTARHGEPRDVGGSPWQRWIASFFA
jgi:hypothetical protein